jgi:flavin-dependent dehydrogenase
LETPVRENERMSSSTSRAVPAVAGPAVYDAVVVGASFAGLAFASVAATRGMKVLVLERDAQVGGIVRTTGILFSDVFDVCDVPQRYLLNAVRRIWIQPPGQPACEVSGTAFRFYMADVTGMLQWMAETARDHGAAVSCGSAFVDAVRQPDGLMRITYRTTGADHTGQTSPETIDARFLIGADGSHSRVAQCLGLDQNTQMLAGAEWLIEGVPVDRETFWLVMDHHLAPGYCVWLAPHGNIAALGVAGHQRAFKPNETLRVAPELFKDVADFSRMRIVERKGGVIPTGGRLRRVYRDDERGRALLLGDAAGHCGAATGGGIYPALVAAKLAGQAVANEVLNGSTGAVKAYLRDLPQAGRLGHYLQIEDWLRWVMDRLGSNEDVAAFYGLLTSPSGRKVLQRTLFEQPIIGMDSGFFALLRNLLGQHPRVYGAAFRAAWQRVTSRA